MFQILILITYTLIQSELDINTSNFLQTSQTTHESDTDSN